MTAVYNDSEPFVADWLEDLIAHDHIAPGRVDRRSITDLTPADVAGPGQRHFFAGIGGWSYALRMARVPDHASIWTGSCPCQPLSDAGQGRGFSDPRHLWPAWFALIRQCLPPIIFGEQVASALGLKWFDLVFADLEGCGYTVGAADLCAAGVGAPHGRPRTYWVAHTERERMEGHSESIAVVEAGSWGAFGEADLLAIAAAPFERGTCWPEPIIRKMDDGAAYCVGRLRAYGNAIVPQVAAEFIRAYWNLMQ